MFRIGFTPLCRPIAMLHLAIALITAPMTIEGQAAPSSSQAQEPVVTDLPSQIRGESAPQHDSYITLNSLLQRYSLARISKRARSVRVQAILNGDDSESDLRTKDILLKTSDPSNNPCDGHHGLLLHLAVWHINPSSISDGKTPRTLALAQSEWHGFLLQPPDRHGDAAHCRLVESQREDGTPSFYRGTDIYFVGLNAFDSLFYGFRVAVDYKLDTIGLVPQNISDLAAGISAISGVQLTPPTPVATQLSPPSYIDTGVDLGVPLALFTVLTNVYQGRVNEMPAAAGIRSTAPRPYGLNTTFFLQFEPSLLTLTQGQILQSKAAPVQSNDENATISDTSLHLKEKLELVARGYDVSAIAPLPPVLSFTSDLVRKEAALSAAIRATQNPSPQMLEDDVALIDEILARDYEDLAVIASAKSVSLQQAIGSLAGFAARGPTNYAMGDFYLPDSLNNNFLNAVDSLRLQIQQETIAYRTRISPSYQDFARAMARAIQDLSDAQAELDKVPQTDDPVSHRAHDAAQLINRLLTDARALRSAAEHLSQQLDALLLSCSNSDANNQSCTRPIPPAPSVRCEAFTRNSEVGPDDIARDVAGCKALMDRTKGDFLSVASTLRSTLSSIPNKDLALPDLPGILTKVAPANQTIAQSSWRIVVSNGQMAEARQAANRAVAVADSLQAQFANAYQVMWDMGSPENRNQKPTTLASKQQSLPRDQIQMFEELVEYLKDVERKAKASIDPLVLAAHQAAQNTSEIASELTQSLPPPSSPPTSNPCSCCCCSANPPCSGATTISLPAAPPEKLSPQPDASPSTINTAPTEGRAARHSTLPADRVAIPAFASRVSLGAPAVASIPASPFVPGSGGTSQPAVDTGAGFLTSDNTGGSISGIPFRVGDFPLIMIVNAANDLDSGVTPPPDCAFPDLNYNPDAVPCLQFVSLTTTAAGTGNSPPVGGGQFLGGQSPNGGGKGQGGGGGGSGGGGSIAQSPTQAVDCSRQSSSSGSCAFTRSFTVDEPEFWDVSLGLAVPGIPERTFTPSKSTAVTANCPAQYNCSLKHHEDAYVFVDLYPFAKSWSSGHPLFSPNSWAPHINAGIPITSQSLYRPYVGLSERVSQPLEHKLGLPLPLSIYAGVVLMKQKICLTAACITNTALSTPQVLPASDRAIKPAFGIEVSITAITGKLTKGSGGSSKGGSGASGTKGGNT